MESTPATLTRIIADLKIIFEQDYELVVSHEDYSTWKKGRVFVKFEDSRIILHQETVTWLADVMAEVRVYQPDRLPQRPAGFADSPLTLVIPFI